MANPAFETALEHQRAGRLELAERAYAEVPEGDPSYGHATFLRASIALAFERREAAIDLFRRALALDPENAGYHSGLAEAFRRLGQFAGAFDHFERALQLRPTLVEAAFRLGLLLEQHGAAELAVAFYEHARDLLPAGASSTVLLERLDAARDALLVGPPPANAAEDPTAAALAVRAWLLLAGIHSALERLNQAVLACRCALGHAPSRVATLVRLGEALAATGEYDEAIWRLRQALEREPGHLDALLSLSYALKDSGQVTQSIGVLRDALRVRNTGGICSLLLNLLPFVPGLDDAAILKEARDWDRNYARPEALRSVRFSNQRDAERRLRVGYVSAHFCTHVNQLFVPPLLTHHDREAVEVFLYSFVEKPDTETEYLRRLTDGWRDVAKWSSAQVAQRIRDDRIDVLVDLSLHTRDNRLLVFARKPAPVQLTWLAHPGTSGLSAMDYRITDPHLDPPGTDLSLYAERSLYLPDCFWCYQPRELIEVRPRPSNAGHVTFGSLNGFMKFNPSVLSLWAEVLRRVPQSRLLLLVPPGDARRWTLQAFAQQGVESDRIQCEWRKPMPEYLATYHEIDICLDPFPYPGGTTSLDAFWMGVPVVTLRGTTVVGRGGVSIAMNLGLPDLIADSPSEYVRIAVQLASDPRRREALRSSLRERMARSPLMDAPRFSRNMEGLYRRAWREWLASPAARRS